MQEVVLEAKTKEEAIKKAEEALNASEKEIVYNITEQKGKLFKGTTYKISATTLTEVLKNVTNYLQTVIENLGIHVTLESKLIDRKFNIEMDSDNNPILIGKNGQTLKSLEILSKQYILNNYNYYIKVNLDVENYKEKRIKNLEHLAKKTAKEVVATQIEVSLENMNSYERRIIHNALTNFKGVTTVSDGEDPNRHVIIKPIEK